MRLHLEKDNFVTLLRIIENSSNIDIDILEKDYYVCVVLNQLALEQDELKAYFKGGTALYKMLGEMRRFSEDIDLTVQDDNTLSNTKNKMKFEKSAKGYTTLGLTFLAEKTIGRKGSITAFYEYETVAKNPTNPLRRSGEIQVESTSFTESEPLEDCVVLPIIYKFANQEQKKILQNQYDVKPFSIKAIKLERTFIDKLFASQKYLEDLGDTSLARPVEFAKHLYDIAVLFNEKRIKDFLKSRDEVQQIEIIRRREEKYRIGGVSSETKMCDFAFLNSTLDSSIMKMFMDMQDKYVLDDIYKISSEELEAILAEICGELRNL